MKALKNISIILAIVFWALGYIILDGQLAHTFKILCFTLILIRMILYVKYDFYPNKRTPKNPKNLREHQSNE
ncbi:hypothetical protein [Olleya aquimaris]|uniref:Uncharacterized protein n=1 Tax=Olleya aquimaris TaxID=639310 RepID=A0A327RNF5_9FLAO|nr:hypothetical protein [Olleya aquimaris]RAJ18031.1 hypothetical protein LY08_00303 [Olleya aquimaris]